MTTNAEGKPEDKRERKKPELIKLAGSDFKNQCDMVVDRIQCGRKRVPGSRFCPIHQSSQARDEPAKPKAQSKPKKK